jgi:hypothetical protein
MWLFVALSVGASISEESAASIFMAEESVHTSVYPSSTLRMEAAVSHRMFVPSTKNHGISSQTGKNSQKMGNFVDHWVSWCMCCLFTFITEYKVGWCGDTLCLCLGGICYNLTASPQIFLSFSKSSSNPYLFTAHDSVLSHLFFTSPRVLLQLFTLFILKEI